MLYLADVLQLVVDGFDDCPFPKQYLVIDVSRGELPLDDFAFVIDDQMELEPIEPVRRALSLGCPPLHCPVLPPAHDVAGGNGRGVDDGYTRALAEGAGLKENQQMDSHLHLTLHQAVIGYGMGKVRAHVPADKAPVE